MFKVRYKLINIMDGDRKGRVINCMAEFLRYEQAAAFATAMRSQPRITVGFEHHLPVVEKAVKSRNQEVIY